MTQASRLKTQSNPLPSGAVKLIAAMLLVAIGSVAYVRLSGVDIRAPDAPAVATRALLFEDRPDGSVAVIDAGNGQTVHRFVGENGFVRGTLRGLARERQRAGFGAQQPFELIGRADGRLTLKDPTTGRSIDLESFGPVNAASFAQLMNTPASPP